MEEAELCLSGAFRLGGIKRIKLMALRNPDLERLWSGLDREYEKECALTPVLLPAWADWRFCLHGYPQFPTSAQPLREGMSVS